LASVGSTGQILQANTAAIPSWSTATYPATATTAGTILRANGTNWVASTSTFADTYTASNLLYASSANTVTGLATGNNGLLVTNATGVPSILAGPGVANKMLLSSAAAAPVWSTSTIPSSAGATANKFLKSDGTNYVLSTTTWPDASATAGKIVRSDGTNWAASTTIWPDSITDTYVLVATAANTIGSDAGLVYDDATDTLTVAGAVVPDAASGADLGSTSLEWTNLYIGTGRAYFGAAQERSIYNYATTATLAIAGLAAGSGAALQYSTTDYSVYYVSSSERYKEDIKSFTDDWWKILETEPKSFTFKASQIKDIGYIAEDFQALGLTNLLYYDAEGLPTSIKYEKISLYLVEIAKAQKKEIEEMKALLNPEGATAATNELEMVDKATGEIYCTWIENGEWMKVKGECAGISTPPPPPPPPTPPGIPAVEQPSTQEQPVIEEPQPDTPSQISSPESPPAETPIE